ncbi:MAG: MFS transporter [Acidobacteria bacterium]|nr:MFS transporter [Acidobacteriota bacterium]
MPTTLISPRARRWWTLAVLSIAQLMVALDATVINIALPRAQLDLNFSSANRQWLITAYALAFGSLLLLGGRLSDLWGRRTALVVGLAGFAVASAVGGAAGNFTTLVIARAVQGMFGALLAPAALAALTVTFREPRERAKAFAIFGAVGASGAAIGLLLGGALTQWSSWRWCLFINLLFAALALVGVMLFVSGGRSHHHTRLDVPGIVVASGGLFLVVYGFSHAVTTSWSNSLTWGSLVGGVLLLVAFVRWEQRSKHPLLPLRLVLNRTRAGSLVALFITSIGIFGISLFLAYYLQVTMGFSPMRTGVAFLPLVGAIALSAGVASARLLAKVGPRPLVPVGMVLSMMGMILFTKLPANSDYFGSVLPGLVVTGLGLGLIFAPAIASATSAIKHRDAGAASALVNTTQQVGGSVGTALLNTIAVSVAARALRSVTPSHLSVLSETHATLHGYHVAFWWAAGFFGVGAILTFFMLESGVPELEGDLVPLI